jgi:hypothetical protein
MSSPDSPDQRSPEAELSAPASGPTDYQSVPWFRRTGTCSGAILAHVAVMFLGFCVPGAGLLGIVTTMGVIAVCIVVLTGPVYYNKRRKDGTLKTWSAANKVAAVILLLLFVAGYGAVLYFLLFDRGIR